MASKYSLPLFCNAVSFYEERKMKKTNINIIFLILFSAFMLFPTRVAFADAPTISSIDDLTIDEDTNTGALAFTIGDIETAVNDLTVTGASSNTTLVPLANIVFGGSGTDRTVTVTPAGNQFGTATIT
ncbi:MAG: hypothetical protein GX654_06995, partial [Desulfatiglans sp.]|nr:hypothetical protein [Desulfatiglans sp.]